MRSQFFIERYAHERHQTHLREAAHDRLAHERPAVEQRDWGRTLRAPAATVLAATATAIALATATGLVRPG